MSDNVVALPGGGGPQFRTFSDGTNEWPASVLAWVTGGSAGAWTLQEVTNTAGLPVAVLGAVSVTGTFWQATQPVSIASTVTTSDLADGPVTPGTAATKSVLMGVQYNTATPTPTNGQQLALQSDANGNLKVNVVAGGASGGTSSNYNAAFPAMGTAAGASDGTNMKPLLVDGSGFLKVNVAAGSSGNAAASATGAAVPASADYQGLNVAGNLRGQTGVNPSGSIFAAQTDLTSVGGASVSLGQTTASASVPVVIASNQTAVAVSGTVTANAGTGTFTTNIAQIGGSSIALGQAAMAASVPVVLASNQTAVPISGTVTANIGTTNGLALDTSVSGILLSQGSTTAGEKGPLIQGAVTTSAPTYTTAQTSPFSLTTAGALRTDSSATTQPVSGTVTANAGTGTFNVTVTTALPAGSAVIGGVELVDAGGTNKASISAGGAIKVDGSAVTQPVSGTVTANAGTGNFATNLAQVGGASVALGQTTMSASLPVAIASNQSAIPASQSGTWNVTVNTALPAGTNLLGGVELVDSGGTNKASISAGGAVKVDGSAVTQPVSGTVTANAGTGTFTTSDLADGPVTPGAVATKSILIGGQYNSAAPTPTTGQQLAFQLDASGNLKVNVASGSSGNLAASATGSAVPADADYSGLNVAGNLRGQTGVNPTGTVYAAQTDLTSVGGTSVALGQTTMSASIPVAIASNQGAVPASQSGTWNVTVNTALPAGSAVIGGVELVDSGGTNKASISAGGAVKVDGSAVTQPVSGTVTANIGTTNGLALDTSINGILVAQGSTTSGEKGPLIQGAVTTSAPTYTTAQTSPLSLTTAGALRTDASSTTQPVSGTVTVNAGTGNFATNLAQVGGASVALGQVAMASSIPVAIASNQSAIPASQSGTWTVATNADSSVGSGTAPSKSLLVAGVFNTSLPTLTTGQVAGIQVDSSGRILVASIAGTTTVSGTVTANAGTGNFATNIAQVGGASVALGQAAMASSFPVAIASNQSTLNVTVATALPAGTNSIGNITQNDPAATTGNITAQDVASSTSSGATGQTLITGTPTANSSVSVTLSGHSSLQWEVSGTFSATLQFERSMDGGTTWVAVSGVIAGSTSNPSSTTTTIGVWHGNIGGATTFRVRCTAFTSGTATVKFQPGYGVGIVPINIAPGAAVAPAATTSGGATPYHLVSAASTNATSVKASAGNVYSIQGFNTNASPRYLKFYNKASSPSVGSDTPVKVVMMPGNASGAGASVVLPVGVSFTTGIAFAITGGIADSDATAVGLNDCVINFDYM